MLVAKAAHVFVNTGVLGLTNVSGIGELAEKRAKAKGRHAGEVRGADDGAYARSPLVDVGARTRGGSDLSSRTPSHAVCANHHLAALSRAEGDWR